ncbi:MAG TPA: hypothetical protein VGM77_04475 [Gemmatimonadales bacterium]
MTWTRQRTALFACALIGAALPYWPISYQALNSNYPIFTTWFCIAVLLGAGSGFQLAERKRVLVLLIMAGFEAAVILRVIVEVTRDPTSHNLWPLELVFDGVVAGGGALIGVVIARLVQRVAGKGTQRGR